MFDGAQVIEKNRFPALQNRYTPSRMVRNEAHAHKERARRRARLLLLMMALAIAVATIAPMTVLAG